MDWTVIDKHISACLGRNFSSTRHEPLGGGCINAAWRVADDYNAFFVKLNTADKSEMFAAEAEGLGEMHRTATVKVPEPVCHGSHGDRAYLVTEYLPLQGEFPAGRLGEQLAALHRHTAERYGWHRDNTIGSTPQPNRRSDNWTRFWAEQRLGFQLSLAERNGYGGLRERGERLAENLDAFFDGYMPAASLLHGDLWSGNVAGAGGEPIIFDPAVYYGDREADLAMTELFGGFPRAFYNAYNRAWPLDAGYPVRKHLYNLYHVLNHLNLFGGGYLSQSQHLIDRLLAQIH